MFKKKALIFDALLLAAFVLLAVFIIQFFSIMSAPDYWHFTDIGAYLSRSLFAIENGFFTEIPYWNYGYDYISFNVYPIFFFVINVLVFHAMSAFGFNSIYWSFFATFLLGYIIGLVLTRKFSRGSSLAFLLATGNIFSIGLLVLMGFNTKIFAFCLIFPAMAWLLDKRENLKLGKKEIAGISIALSVAFAAHLFMFALFSLLFLSVLALNRKQIFKGLACFALLPIITFPYFARFVLYFGETLSTSGIPPKLIGLAPNFYVAIFALFILLFIVTKEKVLAPLAILAAIFALNLNGILPLIRNLEPHTSALFMLGIICYYFVSFDFKKVLSIPKVPYWASRKKVLFVALFALLLLNFVYFPQRIESANLFNKPDYRELYEYGELESVFMIADIEKEDSSISPFVSYQTFNYKNYSVNDWFPVGKAHATFVADNEKVIEEIKLNNCTDLKETLDKMQVKTLLVKNVPAEFSCFSQEPIGSFSLIKNR